MLQQQPELQHKSGEWCEHDPDDEIKHLRGRDFTFKYTWAGIAPQETIDAIPAPSGKIKKGSRDYVVNVAPPGDYEWAFKLVVVDNTTGHPYCTQEYGGFFAPLPADRLPIRVTVDLP